MMLAALVDLAKRQGLLDNPHYEKKRVDFVIDIDRDGRFLSLISRRDEKGRGAEISVPRQPKRSGTKPPPAFCFDNAKYVLAIGDPDDDDESKLRDRMSAFRALIDDARERTGDAGLRAASLFYDKLDDNKARILEERPASEWTGSEALAFSIHGEQGLLHDRPLVSSHWAQLRTDVGGAAAGGEPAGGKRNASGKTRCLVTGEIGTATRLHPPLKRLVSLGGQSSGTTLVSFNSKSFESHGLSQGDNAPISRDAAEAYAVALDWLLEKDPTSSRPFRHGVRLGESAAAVYWTEAPDQITDFFDALWNGNKPAEAKALFESPWSGEPPAELDEKAFYAMTIGANAARAVIYDWFPSTIGDVKHNLKRYFDDLALCGGERFLAIWQLLAAIDPPGRAGVAPGLGARLYASSLKGVPLPRELLRHSLVRLRVPPDREKNATALLHARCALIKATLRGLGHKELTMSLDENNRSVAYNLGRLFAVLERLQGAAMGDPNASIRDRFFGAASSTPAVAFPRLLKLSTHHESKLGGGLAHYFDERKRTIMRNLDSAGLPSTLPLEAQGLFAVGYYHERDWLIEDAKRRAAEKKKQSETVEQ